MSCNYAALAENDVLMAYHGHLDPLTGEFGFQQCGAMFCRSSLASAEKLCRSRSTAFQIRQLGRSRPRRVLVLSPRNCRQGAIRSSTVKACEKEFVNGVNGDFDGGFSWIFHCQVAKNTDPSAHDPSRFNTKAVLAAWAAFIRQG